MKKFLLFTLTLYSIVSYSQSQVESSLAELFNGSSWENQYGFNYEYGTNSNLSAQTQFYWEDSAWLQQYKSTYTYNASNKITNYTLLEWDGSQWINLSKDVYTYNVGGLIIQISEQIWNGTQWENSYQTDISYSAMLPVNSVSMVWDGSEWTNDTRSTFTYTGGNVTQILIDIWDGSDWTDGYRQVYAYNAANKRTSYSFEFWDGSDWTQDESTSYEYDAAGNKISELLTYSEGNQLISEYDYDFSELMANYAHPFKDKTGMDYLTEGFPYVNKLLGGTYDIYDIDTDTYYDYTRTTLNYDSPIVLSTPSVEISAIKLFPNPTTDHIMLSGLTQTEHITIYSALGAKVLEKTMDVNDRIDVQNLSNGLYFLKLENGSTLKFLKN